MITIYRTIGLLFLDGLYNLCRPITWYPLENVAWQMDCGRVALSKSGTLFNDIFAVIRGQSSSFDVFAELMISAETRGCVCIPHVFVRADGSWKY